MAVETATAPATAAETVTAAKPGDRDRDGDGGRHRAGDGGRRRTGTAIDTDAGTTPSRATTTEMATVGDLAPRAPRTLGIRCSSGCGAVCSLCPEVAAHAQRAHHRGAGTLGRRATGASVSRPVPQGHR